MSNIEYVSRNELTSGEIVEVVEDDGRVAIQLSIVGRTINVVIRRHRGTYYCDTPVKLLKVESREDLRLCLERYRLARPAEESDGAVTGAP